MILKRLPDWRERLDAEVQRKALCVFQWGINDCMLFAADLIRAMTGADLGAPYRGRYSTPIGAARILRRVNGARSLPEALELWEARDGWRPIFPHDAASGDPMLMFMPAGPTLAIRFGVFVAAPGARGVELIAAERASVARAWAL